ncbi:glycoside hydrolase family 5 protein [Pseudocercospora fijiensis CIRAD86]|uniref:Glycoside hydrolase family 5 protein n=1 Tax=Pseudocercospora fijiensis (strain CIRAD86) TaxID=383855 RepID=N1QCB7_PSEFD|nr:glycoside hydrolase family 5 protein [Pseudocercospora fijiensis CIRAD86]EME89117.1 glycoside hydrolase family 5 protein [Pseudocercospora fijiensis CIRAD86]
MKRFLDKVKEKAFFDDPPSTNGSSHNPRVEAAPPPLRQDQPGTIQPVTSQDVVRYRYHHGCNIGSIFRWLTPSMFAEGHQGSSELAAAETWVKQLGMDGARQRFEHHWRDYVSDADLDWLRDVAKCTTIRLPIGFYDLGPRFCEKSAFKNVAPVYVNAWQAIKDLIQRCHCRGIGVLIDVHALPGGANGGEHSGTNSGKAEFYHSRKYTKLATECICFIAQDTRGIGGIAGIQIVNEAEWDAPGLYDWYSDVLNEVSQIDTAVPIYISDGWDLGRGAAWAQSRNAVSNRHSNPVVVDTHLYWCFTDADQQKSPQQITGEVWSKLSELEIKDGSVHDRGAVQAIIGEYSCVLGDASWAKGGGEPKEQLARAFGNAQSQRYQQRAGGSFFWTYRMDWMDGGEWGFKQMTNQHAIIPPASLMASDIQGRIENAQGQRDFRRGSTWGCHCSYWDGNHPGEYEHWRFEAGWNVGWNDAMAFFQARSQSGHEGGDKIGMLDLWVLKRIRESGQGGKFIWEFEQGLRQGVRDFYECVGV